jgi:CspA family cold shock protein
MDTSTSQASAQRLKGAVKWFNNAKGFGFIVSKEGDVFVHYKNILSEDPYKTLRAGQWVEYTLQGGDKGLAAKEVVSLSQVIPDAVIGGPIGIVVEEEAEELATA